MSFNLLQIEIILSRKNFKQTIFKFCTFNFNIINAYSKVCKTFFLEYLCKFRHRFLGTSSLLSWLGLQLTRYFRIQHGYHLCYNLLMLIQYRGVFTSLWKNTKVIINGMFITSPSNILSKVQIYYGTLQLL